MVHLISRLASAIQRELQHSLAEYEISAAQWNVLEAVTEEGAATPAGIARHAGIDGAAVTRHLDRLEAACLLIRVRDSDDRRSVNISLTKEGRELAPKLRASAKAVHERFESSLSEREQDQLTTLLRRMLGEEVRHVIDDDWSRT